MLTIYHLGYWFLKIKVLNYQERLIIIDYLTHLQYIFFGKQFRVSIGLGLYWSYILEVLLEMKKKYAKTIIKCLQYDVTIIVIDELQQPT